MAQDLQVASGLVSKTWLGAQAPSTGPGPSSNKECGVWPSLLPFPTHSPGTVQGTGSPKVSKTIPVTLR